MTTRRMIKGTGKPSYISVNRGLALLDEAIEQIELQEMRPNGGDWNQESWRCGSGMCLAGWVAQLAGGKWADPVGKMCEDYLVPTYDDPPVTVEADYGRPLVHVSDRAQNLLEIDDYQANLLFGADNTLDRIKSYRNEFAAKGTIGD